MSSGGDDKKSAFGEVVVVYEKKNDDDIEKRREDALVLERKLKRIRDCVTVESKNVMGSSAGAGSGAFHE